MHGIKELYPKVVSSLFSGNSWISLATRYYTII